MLQRKHNTLIYLHRRFSMFADRKHTDTARHTDTTTHSGRTTHSDRTSMQYTKKMGNNELNKYWQLKSQILSYKYKWLTFSVKSYFEF